MPAIPLPVLPVDGSRSIHITPTDLSQFVRLEQCQRFLRLRLLERAKRRFMDDYGVAYQRISPLLTRSGRSFEEKIEREIRVRYPGSIHYVEVASHAPDRCDNNEDVVRVARELRPGEVRVLFQPRLAVEIDGWQVTGDIDLLRLERMHDGRLHALIVDLKSTIQVKVEFRLQVGFYQLMLETLFGRSGVALGECQTAILYRCPSQDAMDTTPDRCSTDREEKMARFGGEPDSARLERDREAARRWFGLSEALLEVVADPDAYRRAVRDLVIGRESLARRIARANFDDLPYCVSYKCDDCLYNEFCLKDSAEREDLSLLPYMTGVEKAALLQAGVRTIAELATLKELTSDYRLEVAPGREGIVRQLSATWPIGPRLDELVHRARRFRRDSSLTALSIIPDRGHSTLPASTPELNPNLIRIYVEAQHDHLNDRLWALAALVVGCKEGKTDPEKRRVVIEMTDGPPTEAQTERSLFMRWTDKLLRAVLEVAAPDRQAPIHFVLFDRYEQRLLLEGLARNFQPVLRSSPPLYDLLTQLAGFDSPIATFLSEEVRRFKNYPMTCQNLQSLATYLRFDWQQPQRFRDLFRARVFDYIGQLDVEGSSKPHGTRGGPASEPTCRWSTPTPPGVNSRNPRRERPTSSRTSGG